MIGNAKHTRNRIQILCFTDVTTMVANSGIEVVITLDIPVCCLRRAESMWLECIIKNVNYS